MLRVAPSLARRHTLPQLRAFGNISQKGLAAALKDTDGGAVVIDVREEHEHAATGALGAAAQHLPLRFVLEGGLALDAEEFEAEFGFAKPAADAALIFSCAAGVRSAAAAGAAEAAGYSPERVWNYRGGAQEWFSSQ